MDLSLRVNRFDYWNVQSEIPHDKYLEWLAWTMLEVECINPDNDPKSYLTPAQAQLACGQPVTIWNGKF